MSQSVVITGGHGSLAQALTRCFIAAESEWNLICPSRQEMDVSCRESIEAFMKNKPCDLLIAAAGEIADQPLLKLSSQNWDKLLHSNLRGAAYVAKMASRSMIKRNIGHVIFLGSYSAFHPASGQVAYASAKAALSGLTKSLAREWGPAGIRVNLILPGFLENRMTTHVSPARKAQVLEQHCLGLYNTEDSVAEFIYFLHTRMLRTSGQTFNLDSRILAD